MSALAIRLRSALIPLFALTLLSLPTASAPVSAAQSAAFTVTGHWTGTLSISGGPKRVVTADLTRGEGKSFSGTIVYDPKGINDIGSVQGEIKGTKVKAHLEFEGGNVLDFNGKLDKKKKKISGKYVANPGGSQFSGSLSIRLARN